jgi:hypothetical protein
LANSPPSSQIPAAIRASVNNHRFLNRAVDTQQLTAIAWAISFFSGQLVAHAAAAQQRNLFGVFGQQLAELLGVEPNSVACGATIDCHVFDFMTD